jgi:hypothetical protein
LAKPFSPRELVRLIDQILPAAPATEEKPAADPNAPVGALAAATFDGPECPMF